MGCGQSVPQMTPLGRRFDERLGDGIDVRVWRPPEARDAVGARELHPRSPLFEQIQEFLERPQPLGGRDVAHMAKDAIDGQGGEGFSEIGERMGVDEKLHVPAHVPEALSHRLDFREGGEGVPALVGQVDPYAANARVVQVGQRFVARVPVHGGHAHETSLRAGDGVEHGVVVHPVDAGLGEDAALHPERPVEERIRLERRIGRRVASLRGIGVFALGGRTRGRGCPRHRRAAGSGAPAGEDPPVGSGACLASAIPFTRGCPRGHRACGLDGWPGCWLFPSP